MKSALFVSLLLHIAVGVMWMSFVKFTQVRFVPRDVYIIDLVAPPPVEASKPIVKPPPTVVQEPEPEPEPEIKEPEPEPEPEPFVPPKEKPKPKPKPKEKEVKKTIPTTKITKTPDVEEGEAEAEPQPATGDIVIEGQEFPFAYYLTTMKRKIAALWRVPGTTPESKYCTVYFRVGRDGGIHSPSVETSSGSVVFDQAALRAVVQSNPLPPLPEGYTDDYLGVHFSFAYEEE